MNSLTKLDKAAKYLESATDLNDVKEIVDIAQAAQVYAKAAKRGMEAQNYAAEIKVNAECKAGEFLKKLERSPLSKGHKSGVDRSTPPSDYQTALEENDISRDQANRWQAISEIPKKEFKSYLTKCKKDSKEITTSALVKIAKQTKARKAKPKKQLKETGIVTDLKELKGKKYGCIYIDPPWKYSNQGTRAATNNHYDTMSLKELADLPVGELALKKSHLHLWTTNAFLFDCKDLMDAWGFEFKSSFVWVKPQMGIGNYWRNSHEILLLGVKGKQTALDKGCMSWIESKRGAHSAKPEIIRRQIEKLSPGPYLEFFGRTPTEGWTVFGNQIADTLMPL